MSTTPPNRCAIYTRVSTREQDNENQSSTLREYCARRHWLVTAEFQDTASGSDSKRPGLTAMIRAAHQRQFDVLLFYRFDRLSRSGILETLGILKELSELKIEYESYSEPHIRSAGPIGELIISIHATFAQVERDLNSDRTRAGIARARQQGKQIGRPRIITDRDKLLDLQQQNYSQRRIAQLTGLTRSTVARLLSRPA